MVGRERVFNLMNQMNGGRVKSGVVFSVVIPAFNVGVYLDGTISSVLRQTFKSFEIIVVDDGSTDDSYEIANRFSKKHDCIRVISQINQGVGAARNTGLRSAVGQYVVFADGDDWLTNDALEVFAKSFKNNPDAIFGNRIRYDEKSQVSSDEDTFMHESTGPVRPGRGLLRRFAVTGRAFNVDFLRRHSICFPLGMIWEDYSFSYRVLAHANSVDVRKEHIYCYRIRNQPQPSLTQQKRFSMFGLQSRFRQIDDCQKIIELTRLQRFFPKYNFVGCDYGYRLTRDMRYLPHGVLDAERLAALDAYAGYLLDRERIWRPAVTSEINSLFDAILAKNFGLAINQLRQLK